MQEMRTATGDAMDTKPPGEPSLSAALLTGMAAAVGVELSPERAATLLTQAEPHFALLRALDDVALPTTEPAAEFRLDAWRERADD
jgi:hypothetical protein